MGKTKKIKTKTGNHVVDPKAGLGKKVVELAKTAAELAKKEVEYKDTLNADITRRIQITWLLSGQTPSANALIAVWDIKSGDLGGVVDDFVVFDEVDEVDVFDEFDVFDAFDVLDPNESM